MRTSGRLPLRARALPALLAAALSVAVGGGAAAAEPEADPGWTPFEASWSAAGRRRTLEVGSRVVATAYLSGTLVVTRGEGLRKGFRAEALVYDDGAGRGVGAMLLTDDRGSQVFCSLTGSTSEKGKEVLGAITGGTGPYAGMTGDLSFRWQQLLVTADGEVQGLAVDLKGRYRRSGAAASSAAEAPR